MDPLELRQLKIRRSLGAKSSAVKRVAEMVTQEQVTRFAMEAAEATNTFGRLHDKSKVDKNYVALWAEGIDVLASRSLALRYIGHVSISVAIVKLSTSLVYFCRVTYLSGLSRMETSIGGSTALGKYMSWRRHSRYKTVATRTAWWER